MTATPGPIGRDFQLIKGDAPDPAEAVGQLILTDAQQRAGWADIKARLIPLWGDPEQSLPRPRR